MRISILLKVLKDYRFPGYFHTSCINEGCNADINGEKWSYEEKYEMF